MMTRSRFIPLVLVAVLALAAPVLAQGTYTPDEEGWVPLFNGENLDGWRPGTMETMAGLSKTVS